MENKAKFVTSLIVLLLYFPHSLIEADVHTWTTSVYKDCEKFDGCLQIEDRSLYLNSSLSSIPCGFMAPSDLDNVRDYFKKDKVCNIIVYSAEIQAYDVVYNPLASTNYLRHRDDICFILFVDKETLLHTQSLRHIAPGSTDVFSHHHLHKKIVIVNAWQIILINKMPFSSATHSMKTIKLSGPMLFPNAEWLIWYDAKYILQKNPMDLISFIQQNKNPNTSTITFTRKFYGKLIKQFNAASHRLSYMNHTYKPNKNVDIEILEINQQKEFYAKNGLFERTKDRDDLLVDSAIMIYQNNEAAKRYYCAWSNEVGIFSRRDQLSEFVVREQLHTELYLLSPLNISYFFLPIGHVKGDGKSNAESTEYNNTVGAVSLPLPFWLHPASSNID